MREILYRGIPKSDSDRHFFANIWKDNCEGSFVYGSLIISKDRYYICVSALCQINCCINNGMTSMIEVIPETVGQYTGLTDKNGKKIFEGDILRGKHNWHNWNTSFGNDEKDFFEQKIRGAYGKHKSEEYAMFDKDRYFYFRNYAVEYFAKNGGYRVRNGGQFHALTQTYIYNRDLEVIGNIHDNPELLKGGEG